MSSQEDPSLSQSSLAPAPELSVPRTPSPAYASLPDHLSSPSPARALSSSQASRVEHIKYESPPPEAASMTPPPSSQPGQAETSMILPNVRTPTPPISLLSSPPPTNTVASTSMGIFNAFPTPEQVAAASPVELQSMVNELSSTVKAARMAEAHYKLQHSLLSIETSEAAKRMEVEHEMTRREVDLLRSHEQQRQNSVYSPMLRQKETPQTPSRREYELEMLCKSLQSEHDALRRRLRSAKKLLLMKDDENTLLAEENQHLRRRIKDNREHLNRLRGPGGIYEAMTPRTEPGTSQRNTPRHFEAARPSRLEHRRGDGEDKFAFLLAADQVLSQNQDNASAPTTPIRNRPSKQHSSHTRGAHSLSSFPSTPQSAPREVGERAGLSVNPVFSDGQDWSQRFQESAPTTATEEQRKREDRDSTISASDNSDDGDEGFIDEETVPESGASQSAVNMLRHSPTREFEILGTPTTVERSDGLLQSKLFGQVKKAGYDQKGYHGKRKAGYEANETHSKRRAGEGVGLGIGGWGSPRR
ncbi:MAG: hypothetical protein M1819_003776 [Sarea resinae]|nr:MAG: hypothetical protein M1819_003776 [Sarea resinae]